MPTRTRTLTLMTLTLTNPPPHTHQIGVQDASFQHVARYVLGNASRTATSLNQTGSRNHSVDWSSYFGEDST